MNARLASWIAMASLVVVAFAVGVLDTTAERTNADRVLDLSQTIKCPQCQGQSVADSDVAVSREIRRDIARRVEQGQTDDQVRSYYAATFGQDALLSPPSGGVAGAVWALPVIVALVGALGVGVALRRWTARSGSGPSDADRDLVGAELARRRDRPSDDDRP